MKKIYIHCVSQPYIRLNIEPSKQALLWILFEITSHNHALYENKYNND